MNRRHRPDTPAPLIGGGPELVELRRETALGPCKATVLTEAIRLSSGTQSFRVTESWTPPVSDTGVPVLERAAGAFTGDAGAPPAIGEILLVTLFDTEADARVHAGVAARAWSQGSLRSEELAPGGKLRAD